MWFIWKQRVSQAMIYLGLGNDFTCRNSSHRNAVPTKPENTHTH